MPSLTTNLLKSLDQGYSSLSHSFGLSKNKMTKVTSVALAGLYYFKIQNEFSFKESLVCTSPFAFITFIAERYRNNPEQENWFDTKKIDCHRWKNDLLFWGLQNLIERIAFSYLGFSFLQELEQEEEFTSWTGAAAMILGAPVCEEILHKGFFKERIEDSLSFINHYVYSIDKGIRKNISTLADSILFGLSHIVGDQVIDSKWVKRYVFSIITISSIERGFIKDQENSLISPIMIHAINNFCFYIITKISSKIRLN